MTGKEFEGDVLLRFGNGSWDIVVEDGLFKPCMNFDTAAALSLFGGNKDDVNGWDGETWWGNLIPGTAEEEKLVSEFQAVTRGVPLTSFSLKKARAAAGRDLDWLASYADGMSISMRAEAPHTVGLEVMVGKSPGNFDGDSFRIQWENAVR